MKRFYLTIWMLIMLLCVTFIFVSCGNQSSVDGYSETTETTLPETTLAQTTTAETTTSETTTAETTAAITTLETTTAATTTSETITTAKKPIVKEPLEIEFDPTTGYDREIYLFNGDYTPFYKEYDRNLTLDDFLVFEPGATYGEIAARVGNPNGDLGNNHIVLFYMLEDGSYIKLYLGFYFDFYGDHAANKTVDSLCHIQGNGMVTNLWEISLPDGRYASYLYRENKSETSTEKFSKLKIGMQKNTVFSYVGDPNATIVEAAVSDYVYKMDDGSFIIVQMDLMRNEDEKRTIGVTEVYRLDADGTKTVIVPASAD